MGRAKHLTAQEQKRAIRLLVREHKQVDVAEALNRSEKAIHDIAIKNHLQIESKRKSYIELLEQEGITDKYLTKKEKEILESKEYNAVNQAMSRLYRVKKLENEPEPELNLTQINNPRIQIILADTQRNIREAIEAQIEEESTE